MESLLIIYSIFALTTAITAMIVIIAPVLVRLDKEDPGNVLLETLLITKSTFFVLSLLIAPLLLVPSIVPKYCEIFKENLFESLK